MQRRGLAALKEGSNSLVVSLHVALFTSSQSCDWSQICRISLQKGRVLGHKRRKRFVSVQAMRYEANLLMQWGLFYLGKSAHITRAARMSFDVVLRNDESMGGGDSHFHSGSM
jgi:hypothetical protein